MDRVTRAQSRACNTVEASLQDLTTGVPSQGRGVPSLPVGAFSYIEAAMMTRLLESTS